MVAVLALLLAAAGVGIGHAVLPDHWIPLAVASRTQHYSLRRTARLSLAAGLAHVLFSLLLGAVVIAVGLRFRSTIEHHEALVVGGLLAATGLVFLIVEFLGLGHRHDHATEHGHGHGHGHGQGDGHEHGSGHGAAPTTTVRSHRLLAVVLPFGAAASPDLTILPVFLAASAAGTAVAVGTLLVFAVATLATIVGLTTLAAGSAQRLRSAAIDRYAGRITAFVLLVIGLLVAFEVV
jgi:nickel/cobalt transporter (NicO) family protein